MTCTRELTRCDHCGHDDYAFDGDTCGSCRRQGCEVVGVRRAVVTQTLASDLKVGDSIRLGDTSRNVVAVSAPRRGIVTVLVDGIGDWKVAADFPVSIVKEGASA